MRALAFPFRFVNGKVSTVDADSEEYAAQRIAALLQTGYAELPITPQFGTMDPTFSKFEISSFFRSAANYLTDISIKDIQQQQVADGQILITVSFEKD